MRMFAWRRRPESDSDERIKAVERELEELKKKMETAAFSPIRIEYANIEKVVIEHFEHNNNFGALGIKELTGTLNIGANYTGPISEAVVEKLLEGSNIKTGGSSHGGKDQGKPPACNIRSRKESPEPPEDSSPLKKPRQE